MTRNDILNVRIMVAMLTVLAIYSIGLLLVFLAR